ncbi:MULTISPECIES: TRAP transporter small permease [Falsihalocynthiibacter]|uniref:TRAP transporter small permease protein n=1 Tax=Falsihalocynthiibacter arcticus TaxID=1579316 RepID=A0A126UZB0_9RHOB|nr:TRAP transporter small permease [Falsihalocynthiibacter arcticus]AML51412.1 C4-dicarboxylate ABC transporter permease [Falsihalocynthiibacter arcticus]
MSEQRKWTDNLIRFNNTLSKICIVTGAIAVTVMVLTFGWLVFGRYVLNVTPTWVEQLALVLICYITFLGAAAGIHTRSHLGVTLFRDMSPPKVQVFLLILSDLIVAGLGLAMFIYSVKLTIFGWSTLLPMLNVPEGIRTGSAVFCGALVFLFSASRLLIMVCDPEKRAAYLSEGLE